MKENKKEKIIILEPFQEQNLQKIKSIAREHCEILENKKEAIKEATIIIGQPPVSEITKELAPHLKWVQMTCAGTDSYTMKGGFPEGVLLTNATGAFGACIAEYIIGAILSMYFRFSVYGAQQTQGIWKKQPNMHSLEGKTILVLGTGNIGTEFAKRVKAFHTYVIGVRRTWNALPDCFDEMHTIEELDALLVRADIVVCSLPYTKETKGMFHCQRFHQMKKGSILVNVGRGNLIHMDALYEAIQEKQLQGAILDVTNPEPLPPSHPLWYEESVMITPHISGQSFGQSEKTEDRITDICCENLKCYLAGEEMRNQVDFAKGYAISRLS